MSALIPRYLYLTGVAKSALKYDGVPNIYITLEAHKLGKAFLEAFEHLRGYGVKQFLSGKKGGVSISNKTTQAIASGLQGLKMFDTLQKCEKRTNSPITSTLIRGSVVSFYWS